MKEDTRIFELLEQNRQLKAKCKRLDEYDDLVDTIDVLLDALRDSLKFVHSLSSFMGKEGVTEKKIRAAIARAEGNGE